MQLCRVQFLPLTAKTRHATPRKKYPRQDLNQNIQNFTPQIPLQYYARTKTAYKFKITSRYSSSNPWQTIAGFFVCPAEGWKKWSWKTGYQHQKKLLPLWPFRNNKNIWYPKIETLQQKNGNPSWIIWSFNANISQLTASDLLSFGVNLINSSIECFV